MIILTATSAAPAAAATPDHAGGGSALALIVIIAAVAAWIGIRSMVRSLRAGKTKSVTGGKFADYALHVLVNAAKIDGRANDDERRAVARAMSDLAGPAFDAQSVDAAFVRAALTKDELVAYLAANSSAFSRAQKTGLLKALLTVLTADGHFDENEHGALVDYTAAVGFDRQSAPEMLRGLARDFARGRIT